MASVEHLCRDLVARYSIPPHRVVGHSDIEPERKSDPGVVRPGVAQTDLAEVRALFAQLATNHVRAVRDFTMDLRWGEATIEWVDVCAPSLKSLRRAAEKLELTEMCAALDAFSAALAGAKSAGSRTIESYARAAILSAHETLAQLMPQADALAKTISSKLLGREVA